MFFGKEKKQLLEKMQECVSSVQENNELLATTLTHVLGQQSEKQPDEKLDPWRAVYALNLCTVSVSQIIEANDLRFMEQEYENILNNLNLEMMPKNEALLDILKQILDVINYFKIQAKDKELLDKEYQQNLKNAVWSAMPNPSVILSGGDSSWVGLAVTAAISVGTSYMNYRKEKARVENEYERKSWELERSAMEQLHGLQRQLFETAWRLADDYGFDDKDRLTERQIKQYLYILTDRDPYRRFNRLEYIKDKFSAYPPFWYYLGSSALQFAYTESGDICREYLDKARTYFDEFFAKSRSNERLLREDPIVAQCTFEYIAVANMLLEKEYLSESEYDCLKLKDKLDTAVSSSGNALDVLQQCALNYLAIGQTTKAVDIMKALINEQYNVHSNVQLLSVLFVEQYLNGYEKAKNGYESLTRIDGSSGSLYPFISDISEKDQADDAFLKQQKKFLVDRLSYSIDVYLERRRDDFSAILEKNYDITEDVVDFFNNVAGDFSNLLPDAYARMIDSIEKFIKEKQEDRFSEKLVTRIGRDALNLDAMLYKFIESIASELGTEIGIAKNMSKLSKVESKIFAFCEKQSILYKFHQAEHIEAKNRKSVESVLIGVDVTTYKEKKMLVDRYLKIANDPKYKNNLIRNANEVEYLTDGDSKMMRHLDYSIREKLGGDCGKVFAMIKDQKTSWFIRRDLVFTTTGIYVLGSHGKIDRAEYKHVSSSDKNSSLIKTSNDSKVKKIYNQPGVDYKLLNDMLSEFAVIEQSESKSSASKSINSQINVRRMVLTNSINWQTNS